MRFGRSRHAGNDPGEAIAPPGPAQHGLPVIGYRLDPGAQPPGRPPQESPLKQAITRSTGRTAQARQGEVLQDLGRALAEQGDSTQAADALRRAVLAFRAAGDKPRMAGALTDWGVALTGTGRFDIALVAQEAALELVRAARRLAHRGDRAD